jgi:hypothetical protein
MSRTPRMSSTCRPVPVVAQPGLDRGDYAADDHERDGGGQRPAHPPIARGSDPAVREERGHSGDRQQHRHRAQHDTEGHQIGGARHRTGVGFDTVDPGLGQRLSQCTQHADAEDEPADHVARLGQRHCRADDRGHRDD